MTEDDDLLARLGDAIGPVGEDPSEDRVAAVRAAAEEARARRLGAVPLADHRAERRAGRGRRELLTGVAAAAVGLVAGAALWETGDDDPEAEPPTEPLRLGSGAQAATSTAALINHTWGAELVLEGSGYASGVAHRVVFTDVDGAQIDAGGFTGVGDTPMVCRCTSALLRERLVAIEVLAEDDTVAVRADLA